MPMPAVPPPEELRSNAERLAEAIGAPLPAHLRDSPIELRSVGPLSIELARDPSLRGRGRPQQPRLAAGHGASCPTTRCCTCA